MDPVSGRPRTCIINLINANSPLTFDATMLGALKVYARANQATIITPFILAGAMSPVTVAGTAAQTLAESLAGMALVQLLNPGAPVVLGSFASCCRCSQGRPHSARRSLLWCSTPWRRWRDGWAYPSAPAAGCALRRSPMRRRLTSRRTPAAHLPCGCQLRIAYRGLARGRPVDGLREVHDGCGPGGDDAHAAGGSGFIGERPGAGCYSGSGSGQTLSGLRSSPANFENAFYRSPLADNNSFEQWEAEGAKDMAQRANALWKRQLSEYVAPPMDPAIDEALLEYIAKKKAATPIPIFESGCRSETHAQASSRFAVYRSMAAVLRSGVCAGHLTSQRRRHGQAAGSGGGSHDLRDW